LEKKLINGLVPLSKFISFQKYWTKDAKTVGLCATNTFGLELLDTQKTYYSIRLENYLSFWDKYMLLIEMMNFKAAFNKLLA
jgi:hypothetical protein